MDKEILVLSGSTRNGNTEYLIDSFIRGVKDSGNHVNKIVIRNLAIHDCIGCAVCRGNGGHCVQKDDMQVIYEAMERADVIVLASPVYFYTWSATMKRVIDRTFAIEKHLCHKKFYLISTCAAKQEKMIQTMLDCYHQYVSCFTGEDNTDGGYVIGYETRLPGDICKSETMKKAYEAGFHCMDES